MAGFEDRHDPIRAIIGFVLAAAVAVLGLQRTAVAGLLLVLGVVLGVVPVVVSAWAASSGSRRWPW